MSASDYKKQFRDWRAGVPGAQRPPQIPGAAETRVGPWRRGYAYPKTQTKGGKTPPSRGMTRPGNQKLLSGPSRQKLLTGPSGQKLLTGPSGQKLLPGPQGLLPPPPAAASALPWGAALRGLGKVGAGYGSALYSRPVGGAKATYQGGRYPDPGLPGDQVIPYRPGMGPSQRTPYRPGMGPQMDKKKPKGKRSVAPRKGFKVSPLRQTPFMAAKTPAKAAAPTPVASQGNQGNWWNRQGQKVDNWVKQNPWSAVGAAAGGAALFTGLIGYALGKRKGRRRGGRGNRYYAENMNNYYSIYNEYPVGQRRQSWGG